MRKVGEVGMSETRSKRKVEFIESYWTGGEHGSDYQWNDNHGELIRCKDCKHVCMCDATEMFPDIPVYAKCTLTDEVHEPDWFCADGERRQP